MRYINRTTRVLASLTASTAAATLFVVAGPTASASAETVVRYGPHTGPNGAAACMENQKRAHHPQARFGGCYEIGPGTDIWYFNGYWDI